MLIIMTIMTFKCQIHLGITKGGFPYYDAMPYLPVLIDRKAKSYIEMSMISSHSLLSTILLFTLPLDTQHTHSFLAQGCFAFYCG